MDMEAARKGRTPPSVLRMEETYHESLVCWYHRWMHPRGHTCQCVRCKRTRRRERARRFLAACRRVNDRVHRHRHRILRRLSRRRAHDQTGQQASRKPGGRAARHGDRRS
jgi:hypothetical protein